MGHATRARQKQITPKANPIIKKLLSRSQTYRDDDDALILAVWDEQGFHLHKAQRQLFRQVADPQYIKRQRRLLRHQFPASPEIEAKRRHLEREAVEEYGSKDPAAPIVKARVARDDWEDERRQNKLYEPLPSEPKLIKRLKGVLYGRNKRRSQEGLPDQTKKVRSKSPAGPAKQSRKGIKGQAPRTTSVQKPGAGKRSRAKKPANSKAKKATRR